MRALIFCAAVLAACAVCQADDAAKAVISDLNGNPAPETVEPGGVLMLSAKQAVAGELPESIKWLIGQADRAERARTFENGRVIVIPVGLQPLPAIDVYQAAAKGDTADLAKLSVPVQGDQPTPPQPNPGPQPGPAPGPAPNPTPPAPTPPQPGPLPDGQFGVAKIVYEKASQVQSANRAAEAQRLADQLEAVVAQIAAGALKWDMSISGEIKSAIAKAQLDAAWNPTLKHFGEVLYGLYNENRIKGKLEAWATCLREGILGLRAVR